MCISSISCVWFGIAHQGVLGDTNHGGSRVAVTIVLFFLDCIRIDFSASLSNTGRDTNPPGSVLEEEVVTVLMASYKEPQLISNFSGARYFGDSLVLQDKLSDPSYPSQAFLPPLSVVFDFLDSSSPSTSGFASQSMLSCISLNLVSSYFRLQNISERSYRDVLISAIKLHLQPTLAFGHLRVDSHKGARLRRIPYRRAFHRRISYRPASLIRRASLTGVHLTGVHLL